MLQDTNAPQRFAESGDSVALSNTRTVRSLSIASLIKSRRTASWHPSCSCSPLMEVRF